MEILLAAAAAAVYGLGDYCGGRAARHFPSLAVTLAGQIFSLLVLAVALVVLGDPVPGARDWVWGAVGGAGGFVGLTLLYYGLANGSMTVVAPLTAVVSTIVPVAAGLGFGERPGGLAYVGMVVALAGVVLVTGAVGTPHTTTRPLLWLVAVGSGAAIVLLATRPAGASPKRVPLLALVAGVFDMGANLLFLAATREGLLSLVAVITSLYPVSTIVLAMRIDRERVTRSQVIGMLLAGLALALVSLGR